MTRNHEQASPGARRELIQLLVASSLLAGLNPGRLLAMVLGQIGTPDLKDIGLRNIGRH